MNFNETITFNNFDFKLGDTIFETFNSLKRMFASERKMKISMNFPKLEEMNKLNLNHDIYAFKLIIKSIFLFIKNVVNRKAVINFSFFKKNNNLINSVLYDNDKNIVLDGNKTDRSNKTEIYILKFYNIVSDKLNAGFSSSWNSGYESELNISTSVITGPLIEDFLKNYSNLQNMNFKVSKQENQLKSITFQVHVSNSHSKRISSENEIILNSISQLKTRFSCTKESNTSCSKTIFQSENKLKKYESQKVGLQHINEIAELTDNKMDSSNNDRSLRYVKSN